jgi:hypothetical protein
LQAPLHSRNPDGHILPAKTLSERNEPLRGDAKTTLHRGFQIEAQLIKSLVAPVDGIAQTDENGLRGEPGVSLASLHQMKSSDTLNPGRKGSDALFDQMLGGGDQLSSGGWRSRSQIGDEVRNREIRLVADGRDNRELRGCNDTGERFVIEGREIFEGPSTSGYDDEIHERWVTVEPAYAGGHRTRT